MGKYSGRDVFGFVVAESKTCFILYISSANNRVIVLAATCMNSLVVDVLFFDVTVLVIVLSDSPVIVR